MNKRSYGRTRKLLISLLSGSLLCFLLTSNSFCLTQDRQEKEDRTSELLRELGSRSLEEIRQKFDQAKEYLEEFAKKNLAPERHVGRSMKKLSEVIQVATKRVRKLSQWGPKKIERDAEKSFDTTKTIEEYLNLVVDNGPVHESMKKIQKGALDMASDFRAKAKTEENQVTREKYEKLADHMSIQAESVDRIWQLISEQRKGARGALGELTEMKEVYVLSKAALDLCAVIEELEAITGDLAQLSTAMTKVQQTIREFEVGETNK